MDFETPPEREYPSFPDHPEAHQHQRPKVKHSGPGIASFILAITALIGYIVCLSLAVASFWRIGSDEVTEEVLMQQQLFMVGVYGSMFAGLLNVAGIITAIIGLALKNRKKVFAILGLVFGLLPLLLLVALIIIGLAAAGSGVSP